MNADAFAGEAKPGNKLFGSDEFFVSSGSGGGEPAAVAPHHFVDDEHARIRAVFGDDVAEIARTLLGGGPGAEGLADGIDVVVDRLRKTDDSEAVVVLREKCGEIGGGGVGVVSADGVENVDAVFHELVGGDLLRVLAFFHETA